MRIIVGLGNPGQQYEHTRHNVGFLVVDEFARQYGGFQWTNAVGAAKGKAEMLKLSGRYGDLVLLKPTTYMNLSGEAVAPVVRFFKLDPKDVFVVHDELDIPVGAVRLKRGGGEAGHNGLRSLSQHLGTKEYHRVRVGIGKATRPGANVADWVLSKLPYEEAQLLTECGLKALECLLGHGLKKAQSVVHESPMKLSR